MKLWLLRPIIGWKPWYNKAFGFVIRAETEEQARSITVEHTCDEWGKLGKLPNPWAIPHLISCEELTSEGSEGLIIRDFAAD